MEEAYGRFSQLHNIGNNGVDDNSAFTYISSFLLYLQYDVSKFEIRRQ